ncbi:aminopeptidase P N-terminal domain-containing protein [Alcaligenaceae bacterium LF4-65]|uniref:Xaa-Pro aminopeptidase n=1 Tax=Zwartia hollandica TaxID=324606 RepID=A0A953T5I1_9BURK|nr:aminopeptidase P N-terminal domain-containing protein [Zwartia hollandica]MBZ1351651.1 aminopeptidase P N-terminal domain-containing protein [Zwartia hollandica]
MTHEHKSTSAFTRRRQQILSWMRSMGGGIAILPTGPEIGRNRDNHYAFRHDSDFFYLSGFTEANAWLVLIAGETDSSILFCEPKDPLMETWTGKRWGPDAAAEHFGFDRALPTTDLDTQIPLLMAGLKNLFTNTGRSRSPHYLTQLRTWLEKAQTTLRGTRAAPTQWLDIGEPLSEMRLIKDASELDTMQRAATISALGHTRAIQAAQPGMHEYELEAELLYVFRKHGAQSVAYDSIVAAGANACTLHYRAGNTVMRDGDLVLIDAGCELDGYASDITRTFPANGHFSAAQRALYEIVLAAQHAATACVSPDHHWNAAHEAAVRVLTQGLLDEKLLTGTLEQNIETESFKRFYMHRTGHWLGMDVHDVGDYRTPPAGAGERGWRTLMPGMVLTIEPGLYVTPSPDIPEIFWDIGIRIEDDAVVTQHGCELLTRGVPVEIRDIEDLMQQRD